MDKLKDLITFFLKIAFALMFFALIIWFFSRVPQSLGVTGNSATSSSVVPTKKADILPSPRQYSGFFTTKKSSDTNGKEYTNGQVYVPNAPYNGYASSTNGVYGGGRYGAYTYSTYTYSSYASNNQNTTKGTDTQTGVATTSNENALTTTMIRNLSIYKGGHIYTGLAFVGEAKSSMFREGKFPIIVVDASGKVIGVSMAVAQNTWSAPGWVRFETKVTYALPSNAPCTMIFEEALTQTERTRQPQRSSIPVRCN